MKSKDKDRLQAVCLCAWLHDSSCRILSRPCTHVYILSGCKKNMQTLSA